jgi:hypothetical protein
LTAWWNGRLVRIHSRHFEFSICAGHGHAALHDSVRTFAPGLLWLSRDRFIILKLPEDGVGRLLHVPSLALLSTIDSKKQKQDCNVEDRLNE